uniref:Uncharacterized protein n=1 Tax=Arundo donax TaxID=35708 RepID=A0A0A8Z8B1_ARUDO
MASIFFIMLSELLIFNHKEVLYLAYLWIQTTSCHANMFVLPSPDLFLKNFYGLYMSISQMLPCWSGIRDRS